MFRLAIFLVCFSMATAQRNGNAVPTKGIGEQELQRQNRITAQIVANYLERRLFPFKRPTNRLPTLDEILPTSPPSPTPLSSSSSQQLQHEQHESNAESKLKITRGLQQGNLDGNIELNDEDYTFDENEEQDIDPESLQSVESNHVDSYYPESNEINEDCVNCVDESQLTTNRWTMPIHKLGDKRYYVGTFFKANWYKASQYCRFHGMHLASISSQEENDRLEKHIKDYGFGNEHFWTSGTDLADEGNFFWMANGRPITFTNWNAGEPNNFRYENGEEENCLELWNRDGKGLKWNDSPCSFETYFVCEVQ